MVKDKNEFNKKSKRNKSFDVLQYKELDAQPAIQFNNHIGDVSEDDEEEISDSSFEK